LWPAVPQFGSGSVDATFGAIVSEPLPLNPSPLNENCTSLAWADTDVSESPIAAVIAVTAVTKAWVDLTILFSFRAPANYRRR
jgi:hypothetical protein